MIDFTTLTMFLDSIFHEAFAWIGGVLLLIGFFWVFVRMISRIRG